MIEFEYFILLATTTSLDIVYKMSGNINTDGWRSGIVSDLHRRSTHSETLLNFARREAALMKANLSPEPAGRLTESQDIEVELVRYDIEGDTPLSYQPKPFGPDIKSGKLTVEYVHLPAEDEYYHYLMRFKSPVSTLWEKRAVSPLIRQVGRVNGALKQWNEHRGLGETIRDDAKSEFEFYKKMEKSLGNKDVGLLKIDSVVIEECKLIKARK